MKKRKKVKSAKLNKHKCELCLSNINIGDTYWKYVIITEDVDKSYYNYKVCKHCIDWEESKDNIMEYGAYLADDGNMDVNYLG